MLFALNLVFFCALKNIGAIRVEIIQNALLFINCPHLAMNAPTYNGVHTQCCLCRKLFQFSLSE